MVAVSVNPPPPLSSREAALPLSLRGDSPGAMARWIDLEPQRPDIGGKGLVKTLCEADK